jgi:hypothetical protein
MAHFARLDENNIVREVIVVENDVLLTNGVESEQKGIDFCKSLYGENTVWKQTSYNTHANKYYIQNEQGQLSEGPDQSKAFRANYAEKNTMMYDATNDVFKSIAAPYASWILNTNTWIHEPPIAKPNDGRPYRWDEDTVSWVEIV